MRIKQLFKSIGIVQSIGGLSTFLDKDNCCIKDRKKGDNCVILCLERETDGEKGEAYLRVLDEFEQRAPELLRWVFEKPFITGMSIKELEDLETGIEVECSGGRLQIIINNPKS